MAEYTEVIKQFKRMCWYYSRDKEQKSCPICTSYPNCNIGQCRKIAFEQPTCFKDVVMAWAADHPEPVYLTWVDWLVDQGLIFVTSNTYAFNFLKATDPIPADIAQLLGLKPLPVVHGDCGATNYADARKKLGIEPKEG